MTQTTFKKNISGICLFLMLQVLSLQLPAQTSNAFGGKDWISNGLAGKIYALPENTQQLPDFDTMRSLGTIYTKEINVPNRDWTEGFPGVTDRFEWFGIEYKGSFTVKKPGHYTFQLSSDDGSKLFIDNVLVIDNDGLHSQYSKSGEVNLDNSTHKIKIQYFQGPRTEIGLQLFVKLNNAEEEVFPSKNFKLSTPGNGSTFDFTKSFMILVLLFLVFLVIIILKARFFKNSKLTVLRRRFF